MTILNDDGISGHSPVLMASRKEASAQDPSPRADPAPRPTHPYDRCAGRRLIRQG